MGRATGSHALAALALVTAFPIARAQELKLSRELAPPRPAASRGVDGASGDPGKAAIAALPLRVARELSRLPGKPPSAPPRPYPGPTQPLIVDLKVNAISRGEKFVHATADSGLLMKVEDLEAIVRLPDGVDRYDVGGEPHVLLGRLPGASVTFDEKTLTVQATLPPEGFEATVFDLSRRSAPVDLLETPRSALVNYRLGYFGTSGNNEGVLSLATEAAFSIGNWLLRNQSTHLRSDTDTSSVRLETQAIWDDRANLRRLTIGDTFTPGVALGGSAPFGGLTFAKAYLLDPAVVKQPSVGFRGLAEFPSEVNFYVGNTLVLRQRVDPGPFEIRNFNYYGGRQDVRVVVRDIFGRERAIAYPFYFANQGLAPGLHDYSYQVGVLRENLGAASNEYGPAAFSAFHRYGFSDAWTLGLRAEGTASYANAGPEVVFRNERAGVFAASAAASHDRDRNATGSAFAFSHAFQLREYSSQIAFQRYSGDYVPLHSGTLPLLPRSDLSAVVGYSSPWLGSVNLGLSRQELPELPETRAVTLSYSHPLPGRGNLFAVYRRDLGEHRGYELFLGLQFLLGGNHIVNASFTRDLRGTRAESVQVSRELPRGEGFAYSLGAQRRDGDSGSERVVTPRVEWNSRYATLAGEATSITGSAVSGSTTYSVSMAGALVAAGGHVALSRPITDSFAVVQITPPIAGVRVYENSQEIGRTDASGRVLLPNIASYSSNFASIDDKDIPIEYSIEKVGKAFSPSYRSGTYVPFSVTKLQGFTGRMSFRRAGEKAALEYHLVTLAVGTSRIEIPTGRNGDFYVENLPAGRHHASVAIGGKDCEFDLVVPESADALVSLDEVFTCSLAH